MSIMTRGVISMPYKLAMHSEMNRRQFHSHAQVLLAERDQLFGQTEQLKAENARSTEREILQLAEIEALRKALTTIRDESTDLSASECAADALIDSVMLISTDKSQAISQHGRDSIVAAMTDEPTVNFDIDRMKEALKGPFITLPAGMKRGELREWLHEQAKLRGEGGTQSGRNMAESLDTEGLKGGIQ